MRKIDNHIKILNDLTEIKATYWVGDNDYVIWYDDCGDLICEVLVGKGEPLIYDCETLEEFMDYCHMANILATATN